MTTIYDDESINSYFFRCMRIYGVNSFHSIIGHNGHWHSLPEAPNSLVPFLRMLSDVKLFKSLQREGHFNFSYSSISNPIEIVKLLKKVYGGSSRISNSKGSCPILYCPYCFKEMIIKYGHAYFKHSWKNNINCVVHQSPLLNITGVNVKESIRNIDNAISDVNLLKCTEQMKNPSMASTHSEVVELVEPQNLKFSMPCTFNAAYFFVREYYSFNSSSLEFQSSIYSRMFYNSLSPKMYGIFFPLMKSFERNVIYEALDEIKRLDYKAWLSFNKYGMKSKPFPLGFNQSKSLTVTIIKNANRNCSKCSDFLSRGNCAYDMVIERKFLDSELYYFSPCELRLIRGFNPF